MSKVLVLLIVASFLMTGCAGVDVYTYKKDRVDQEIAGNKGYLEGKAPVEVDKEKSKGRTIIGIDIDLGSGLDQVSTSDKRFKAGSPIPENPAKKSGPEKRESKSEVISSKHGPDTVIVETGEEDAEEVWIK